jgi:hypothetical protein
LEKLAVVHKIHRIDITQTSIPKSQQEKVKIACDL